MAQLKGKQNFNNLHDTLLCLTIKYDKYLPPSGAKEKQKLNNQISVTPITAPWRSALSTTLQTRCVHYVMECKNNHGQGFYQLAAVAVTLAQ